MSSGVMLAPRPSFDTWGDEDQPYFQPSFGNADAVEDDADTGATWVREEFDYLADELAAASIAVSSTRRLRSHPAYIGILSLGGQAIPLLLERLRTGETRPTWLSLLGLLTKLPPAAGAETIDEAADAWLTWGMTELTPEGKPGARVFYAA